MATIIIPTPGRIIWYRPPAGALPAPTPVWPAMICKVHNERSINIAGHSEDGWQFTELHVPLLQAGDELTTEMQTSGYAEWMPYQQQQADKAEPPEPLSTQKSLPLEGLPTGEDARLVVKSGVAHVWLDTGTGKFHFSDEAEQIDPTPYATRDAAVFALKAYCETL